MKKILAIGGAVIKTAKEELREYIKAGNVEMLIHNGGSIFHDFQNDSIPLDELMKSIEPNREASEVLIDWFIHCDCVEEFEAPKGSITQLCIEMEIPILMFTVIMGDFWQLFTERLDHISFMYKSFDILSRRFFNDSFHFVNMGSAVVHPEVFLKALSISGPKNFRADVVDFKPNMYRPLTRVAKYGEYYCMTHKEWLEMEMVR